MTDFPPGQYWQGPPPKKFDDQTQPEWELTLKLRRAIVRGVIAGFVMLVLSLPYYRLFTQRGHQHGMFFWWADVGSALPWLAGFWAFFSFCLAISKTQGDREWYAKEFRRWDVRRVVREREAAEQRKEAEKDRLSSAAYEIERQAKEAKRQEEREEASRRYAQSLAREQAEKVRQRRITELEAALLRAFAAHALAADFAGDPLSPALVADFLKGFLPTAPADIGLLRESTNSHVRRIIGDGSRLPAAPALPG